MPSPFFASPPGTRRIAFLGVVPSPYQTDLLNAFQKVVGPTLSKFWLEGEADDSPWEKRPLKKDEVILPGICLGTGRLRSHLNWDLPNWRDFDLIIINTSLTALTTQGLIRFGLKNVPWIFWGEVQNNGWKQRILASPLQQAKGIIGMGEKASRDYQWRFPGVPVQSVPYHCDLSRFQEQPAQPGKNVEVVFLFCGQMIPRKGFDLLLHAFQRLVSRGLPVRLVLVGREDPWGKSVLGKLSGPASARVTNHGFQPIEALPTLFSNADVLVLPSRREGWGVVVNQALGAGLPLILSDAVEAGREMLTPGENGWRVESNSVDSLTDAMLQSVEQRDRLNTMGRASWERSADWSPAAGARKLMAALEKILE
jgi:glycosyltransferase involved in cell wall biosynthesis